MTIHRFFITPDQIQNEIIILSGDQARQISGVLRLREGDQIYVLDNSGWRYEVKLLTADSVQVVGSIVTKQIESGEPTVNLTLYQSLLKQDKFEWILQKGTELGITSFVPIITQRSIVRQTSIRENKLARWQRIVTEASEQSGRGQIPVLSQPIPFKTALSRTSENDLALIPWENEKGKNITASLAKSTTDPRVHSLSSLALFIGPEGGFTEEEIIDASSAGIIPVTLGPRILRAETAAIVATALILQELGELN